jgi:DNA polymerase-3 subunit delta'
VGFEEIIGQDLVLESLKRTIKSGEIGHAYLFSGPAGSGKKTLALLFAQALNCRNDLKNPCQQCLSCRKILSGNHPDLYIIKPQGASLKIGQLREVKDSLYLLAVEGRKKICIIYDAELLTLPAANSLLKILEEPPQDLVFILLTARLWDLPPTVVSRCTHFTLTPLPGEKMKQILGKYDFSLPEEREIIIALAGGNPGKGLEMASRGGWENKYKEAFLLVKSIEDGPAEDIFLKAEEFSRRDDLQEFLELLLLIYRDRLVLKLSSQENVLINSLIQPDNKGRVESSASTGKILVKEEDQKNTFFLEKICRALMQLQGELHHNINLRLAMEVLFLKMRGAV